MSCRHYSDPSFKLLDAVVQYWPQLMLKQETPAGSAAPRVAAATAAAAAAAAALQQQGAQRSPPFRPPLPPHIKAAASSAPQARPRPANRPRPEACHRTGTCQCCGMRTCRYCGMGTMGTLPCRTPRALLHGPESLTVHGTGNPQTVSAWPKRGRDQVQGVGAVHEGEGAHAGSCMVISHQGSAAPCAGQWGDAQSSGQPGAGQLALPAVLLREQLWRRADLPAPAAGRRSRAAAGELREAPQACASTASRLQGRVMVATRALCRPLVCTSLLGRRDWAGVDGAAGIMHIVLSYTL